jgi:Fic-DOC domain mobile mystery protein B
MMKFEYPNGATPLDPDEIDGLIPEHISIQNQLNEWENNNILNAENWLFSIVHRGDFLTIDFIRRVHLKMFDKTWKWAGQFRSTEKNIGVRPYKITTDLVNLLEDVRYQIINQSFLPDEIAYRLHHRLVTIHPFANGNGRHARLITDFLLIKKGLSRFSWGKQKLEPEGPIRKAYIDSLRKADAGDYGPLAAFVRS